MADKSTNGVCVLPISRIKTIMKSSPEVSNISQESLFLVSKSTEYFIKELATSAYRKRKNEDELLEYSDLATIVNDSDPLQFLQDVVPHKVTVKEYYASTGRKMPLSKEEKKAGKEAAKLKEKKDNKGKAKEADNEENETEENDESLNEMEEKDESLNETGEKDASVTENGNTEDDDSDDVQIIGED